MTQATYTLSFTATDLGTFEDCEARFAHSQQRYRDGLLPSDRTAADVGSAVHDALMALHRQVEADYRKGRLLSMEEASHRLQTLLHRALWAKRLDPGRAAVAERLQALEAGLEAVTALILSDMPVWALDPLSGDPLVWVEAALDHGPAIRAVELADGYLVRTRPDVIGIRVDGAGGLRILVRDYKSRGQVVDPGFDSGILVRALWALAEIDNSRCRWFLVSRQVDVDMAVIDVETVNLMHGATDEFVARRSISRGELQSHRDRLTAQMLDMAVAAAADDPNDVPASPSAFCLDWCPYLAKCQAGLDHARKYHGAEALELRLLQQLPS